MRALRLTASGQRAMVELTTRPIQSIAAGTLARRLTDAGVAHPRPPDPAAMPDATVIVPVRDRSAMLDRCLHALGRDFPVIVVDDASLDPEAVARVAAKHGATLIARATNGGPAAARNTGISAVDSEVLVLLDSDCVPARGWIEQLAAHLADPLVAAAAPRIVAAPSTRPHTTAGRYTSTCESLDLGDREARVVPLARVSYVPTAALVVRREALVEVADGPSVFDPALRCGEDVDLIWRLHRAGWRIRYDPRVQVGHHEPETWPALLARRFRYGTSAAPLARRHPEALTPLVLQPWPTLTLIGLLARRASLAGAAYAVSVVATNRVLRQAGLPARGMPSAALRAVHRTWLATGRYCTRFAAPLLVVAVAVPKCSFRSRPGSRRWSRQVALASLLLGPAMTTWANRRPALDPLRFALGQLAEDVAYGSGVWLGCARNRTIIPVRPVVGFHSGK